MTDFAHTRAAIAIYDAGEEAREKLRLAILSSRTQKSAQKRYDAWVAAEAAADEALAQAFYEDTKAYNRLENCRLVHVENLRRMVAKHTPGVV